MSRVFLMKWYHFSVEYFEDLRNVNHCEFLIMRREEDSGKYILENNLRTWSELKRERLAALKTKEAGSPTPPSKISTSENGVPEKDKEKEKKSEAAATTPVTANPKWGGCPNGCNHSKHYYKKENSMHAMQLNEKPSPTPSPIAPPPDSFPFRRPNAQRWQSSSDDEEDDPPRQQNIDVQKSLDEVVSSPGGTPSFISIEDRLRSRLKSPRNDHLLLVKHAGRDFGGSASGNTSQAGSDTEFSAEEEARKIFSMGKKPGQGLRMTGMGGKADLEACADVGSGDAGRREESQMGRGVMADALGDQSEAGTGVEEELEEELEREEIEDKSVRGSIY